MTVETEPPGVTKFKALVSEVAPLFPDHVDRTPGAPTPNQQIDQSPGYAALFAGLQAFSLEELQAAGAYVSARKHEMLETHPENPLELSQSEKATWHATDPIYASWVTKKSKAEGRLRT